jgi:hypothetical protein
MSRTSKSKPTLEAFVVNGEGEQSIWTKVGAAWPHDDGKGFNIAITPGVSLSGKVVLREPRPQSDAPLK